MYHSKLYQTISLRGMLQKWRRLVLKKADSFSEPSTWAGTAESAHLRRSISLPILRDGGSSSSSRRGSAGRVPAGHLAVYVGEERRRFVIKMGYLSHPLFKALLKKTEEEIGFQQQGALAFACEVAAFKRLLLIIQSCKAQQQGSVTSLLHHRAHYSSLEEDACAADEQYEKLLRQLLEPADHALYTGAHSRCKLSRSFSTSVAARPGVACFHNEYYI